MSSILLSACVYLHFQERLEGGHKLFLPSSRVSQQGSVDLQVGRGRALHLIPPLSPTSRTLAPPSSTAPAQTPAPASPPSSTPGPAPSPSSQLQAREERKPLEHISLPLTGGALLVTRLLLLVLPGIAPPAVVVVPGNRNRSFPFSITFFFFYLEGTWEGSHPASSQPALLASSRLKLRALRWDFLASCSRRKAVWPVSPCS